MSQIPLAWHKVENKLEFKKTLIVFLDPLNYSNNLCWTTLNWFFRTFLFIYFSCFYYWHTFSVITVTGMETNALVDNVSFIASKWGINESFGLFSIDSNPKVKHDKFMLFFFTFSCRDNIDECIKSWLDLTTIFSFLFV